MTTNSTQPSPKTLHRSDDRVIGGVCSGIAEYAGIDTTLVRILAVGLTVFAGGGLVLYLVAWLIMPDARGAVLATRRARQAPVTPPAAPAQDPQHAPTTERTTAAS